MASNGPKPTTNGKQRAAPVQPATAAKPVAAKVATPKPVTAKPAPAVKSPAAKARPVAAPVVPAPAAVPEPVAAKPVLPEPVVTTPPAPAQSTPAILPAAVLHKEKIIMEAAIKDATDKTQAFIGEANARAKSALEKSAKAFEELNEFGKGNLEAVVESGKIAAKGLETLGQDAAEYSRKQFEGATAILKSFASVKSPTELFKLQSDFFRSSFDALVAESSKTTEAVLKLAGEVAQPISNRVALAAEKAKIAA